MGRAISSCYWVLVAMVCLLPAVYKTWNEGHLHTYLLLTNEASSISKVILTFGADKQTIPIMEGGEKRRVSLQGKVDAKAYLVYTQAGKEYVWESPALLSPGTKISLTLGKRGLIEFSVVD